MQIVARLAVHWMAEITPEDYGANNISAAMDRMLLTYAVHKCEADGSFCSQARLQREVRIPVSNVRRALAELVERGVLVQDGRRYKSAPPSDERRNLKHLGSVVDAILMAAKELAELDGSRLLITTNGGKRSPLNRAEPS